MKKFNLKQVLIPTFSLFAVCLVAALLLGFTNELTRGPIADSALSAQTAAMKSVCPSAESFESVEADSTTSAKVNLGRDSSGTPVGYAVRVSTKGYGGDIELMVGFSEELSVTGVEVLSCSETPGLGKNVENSSFRKQYSQDGYFGEYSVTKDGTGGTDGRIDAVTGATISSNAVTQAVNSARKAAETVAHRGGER